MQHIELYLEKFKAIGDEDFLFKEKVANTINEVAHIGITKDDVVLRNGVIVISVSGVKRTELALHKEEIIEKIKTEMSIL